MTDALELSQPESCGHELHHVVLEQLASTVIPWIDKAMCITDLHRSCLAAVTSRGKRSYNTGKHMAKTKCSTMAAVPAACVDMPVAAYSSALQEALGTWAVNLHGMSLYNCVLCWTSDSTMQVYAVYLMSPSDNMMQDLEDMLCQRLAHVLLWHIEACCSC